MTNLTIDSFATADRRADLLAQIANIEARIERLTACLDAGNEGDPYTLRVQHGRLVTSGRNRSFLNANLQALADRQAKLAALDLTPRYGIESDPTECMTTEEYLAHVATFTGEAA